MSALAIPLIFFALGILLNGLFAGYETGFLSSDRIRVRYQAENEEHPQANRLLAYMKRPERMITTVLVGTNIALIVGTMAIASQISQEWLTMLIATPAFLIFAEIIPKTIFRRHPNRLSLMLLPLIRFFDFVLAPLVFPTMAASKALRWLLGVGDRSATAVMSTEEDFRNLIDESAARGSIEREEQEMIHSVMDLPTIQAKAIMVPRIDIQALSAAGRRTELIELFHTSGRTRIPIYEDTVDSIVGVINIYDVLLDECPDQDDVARFICEVPHVPDTKPVDELLQELKATHQHMAIVTDEYGGTDGLVTLEDILEEIFGEIQDEHDREQEMIVQVGASAFVVDARLPLEDLAETIEVDIEDETVETVGGWVMRLAERIPIQGEKIRHDRFRITILDGTGSQILKVRIDVLPSPQNTNNN